MILAINTIHMRADRCELRERHVHNVPFDRNVSTEELLLVTHMRELAQCKFRGYKRIIYSHDLFKATEEGECHGIASAVVQR